MASEKRIIYVASGRSISGNGPGTKIMSILSCWRKAGYSVEGVFGGDLSGGTVSPGGEYGDQTHFEKWYRQIRLLDPLVRSASEWRDIKHHHGMTLHLNKLVRSFRPHLIWERSSRLHCAGLVAAREQKIPYVLEWKDNLITYPLSLFHSRAMKMETRKNQEADFIVVESGVLSRSLVRGGINEGKVLVAHNAVDPDRFFVNPGLRQETRKDLGISEHEVVIGYLGSYAFYHDPERLILAADILRKRNLSNSRVLMVGAGSGHSDTRALAERLHLLDTFVIMHPAVPGHRVPAILSALDITVLPGSTDIICPIKVQEYMAAELPTVLPDYPCNREVIRQGETGMFFEPHNEISLAGVIEDLVRNANLRRHIGTEARNEVKQRFSWEATWGAALSQVLERIGQGA